MNLWRWASLAGIAFLAITVWFGVLPDLHACPVSPEPILAFEFVRTPGEVAALFPTDCREVLALAGAQRFGLWLDILGFVPVYSALIILTLAALGRENPGGARLVRVAIALTVVGALADQWENTHLLRILAALPGDQPTIDALIPAVRAKFLLLTVVELLIAALHFSQPGWRKFAAAAIMAGGAVSLAGLAANHLWLIPGGALAMVAMILANWVLALRRTT